MIDSSINRHEEPTVVTLDDAALPAVAEFVVDSVTDETRVWARR